MSDQDRWELRDVLGCPFLRVLAAKGAEKTFLDKFAEKRQNREAAVYVAKTLQQVVRDGIARSLTVGRIKRLKGNIVEVKAQGTVVRCLAYCSTGGLMLVLLSVERTHQGSGNMHPLIEEAERKAAIVEALIDEGKES